MPLISSPTKKLFKAILADDENAVRKTVNLVNLSTQKKSANSLVLANPNQPCHLGFTPLHLAATLNRQAIISHLLTLPPTKLNINITDVENNWTALHRALYYGNLQIALELLDSKADDIDLSIKDYEKNTAFDLLNSTIDGTSPNWQSSHTTPFTPGHEVYTWGNNSNFILGHSNSDDRSFPERIIFPDLETQFPPSHSPSSDSFTHSSKSRSPPLRQRRREKGTTLRKD